VAYMLNDAGYISRNERRAAVKRETAARVTGNWGPWERIETPHGGEGTGWVRDIRYVFRNSLYVVLCRPVRTEIGEVVHCAIRTASNLEPPWRDKQRIKNECFGEDRVAVEVIPTSAPTSSVKLRRGYRKMTREIRPSSLTLSAIRWAIAPVAEPIFSNRLPPRISAP
jgi:hypothetical protein